MKLDKRLLAYLHKGYLLLGGLLGLLSGLLLIAQGWLLATIISRAFLQKSGFSGLDVLLLALGLVISGRAALGWFSDHLAFRAARNLKTDLRQKLLAQLNRLGPQYTRQERSGELSTTLTEGIEALDPYFSQFLPQLFLTTFVPPLVLLAVWSADWLSGLVLLLTAPLLPLFMALIGWLTESRTKRQWQALSFLSAHFLDVLQGLTTLKLLGRSKAQVATIERVSDQFRRTTLDVLRIAFLSGLVMELGATLSTAVVAVEIGFRLLYAQLEFAPTLFVLLLVPEFYLPLRLLGQKYHAAQAGGAAIARIFEILEIPAGNENSANQKVAGETLHQRLQTQPLHFEQVCYTYPSQDEETRPALQNVTFLLAPSQKVALVGPSGSGKSTLANLLLRFAEPTAGQILLGDLPLSELDPAIWRDLIAWLPQKPYLFNTSVLENIRLGRPTATLAEVETAARAACAHDFIQALPQGYQTIVGERSIRLSGGQIQRLALARAFLKDAPLIVLDEATSYLDTATERELLDATARLLAGRTTLIIAHRLATVQQADQIIVLDAGQVVEVGSPQILLANGSLYSKLAQAGLTGEAVAA